MASTPEPWTTVAVRHSRLLRPFPIRKLADELYFVVEESTQISQQLDQLYRDPPSTPGPWVEALDHLGLLLGSLEARCRDAVAALEVLGDRADGDHRRAVDAMVLILKGMSEPPPDAATGEAPALRAA